MRAGYRLLYQVTSVKWLMIAILLFLTLAYCSWMCIHYHIQHYTSATITSQPADYFGMIVGFFTLLITLLVTWQIISTIRAKNELNEIKDALKDQYENEIVSLQKQIKEMKGEITSLTDQQADTSDKIKDMKLPNIALSESLIEWVNFDIAKRGTNLYNWLWSFITKETTMADILTEYERIKATNPLEVSFIDGREATDTELINLVKETRKIKLDALKYKDM